MVHALNWFHVISYLLLWWRICFKFLKCVTQIVITTQHHNSDKSIKKIHNEEQPSPNKGVTVSKTLARNSFSCKWRKFDAIVALLDRFGILFVKDKNASISSLLIPFLWFWLFDLVFVNFALLDTCSVLFVHAFIAKCRVLMLVG